MSKIQASGIREQDIDLLIWEECISSPGFLRWFLGKIGIIGKPSLVSAARSVMTDTGESDLELDLGYPSGRIRVLIENKVGATFQPDQAKRYRDRADRYKKQGQCVYAQCVIVAPRRYFGDREDCCGFDSRVTYEMILAWFKQGSSLGRRRQCKTRLLQEAINRSGQESPPDEAATDFWRQYWTRVCTIAPDLRMRKPGDKPRTSWFMRFEPLALERGVALIHKLPYERVDLQFAGKGDRLAEFERKYQPYLERGMAIDRANKSAVVRITVPKVGMADPFGLSRPAVDEGIRAAARLLAWWKRVRHEGRNISV